MLKKCLLIIVMSWLVMIPLLLLLLGGMYWGIFKGAENGDAGSQRMLADFYASGLGPIKADKKKAVYWYSKAAEQGDAEAQFYLGICYLNGFGVNKDQKQAVMWWEKAAAQGSAEARDALYEINVNGSDAVIKAKWEVE